MYIPFILLTGMLGLLTLPAYAIEPQYRVVDLTDGRTLMTEIVETKPLGLSVALPQGPALIPFDMLKNIQPITRDAYLSQDPMLVWVYAPERQEMIERLFADIPNTVVMPQSDNAAAAACGADFNCIQTTLVSDQWYWIVYAAPPTDERDAELVFRARPSTGSRVEVTDCPTLSPDDIWQKAQEAVGLISTKPRPLPGIKPGTELLSSSRASNFVPIPGHQALRRGNLGGFATSTAITTVGTGVVTAIMLSQDMDGHTTGAASALSFYTLAVTTNYLTSRRRNKR